MSSSSYSEEQLSTHQRLLEQEVFQVETKWPHFRQLLREIRKLASDFPPSATVVSLERGLLYGGISLLGPFFHRHEFVSVTAVLPVPMSAALTTPSWWTTKDCCEYQPPIERQLKQLGLTQR